MTKDEALQQLKVMRSVMKRIIRFAGPELDDAADALLKASGAEEDDEKSNDLYEQYMFLRDSRAQIERIRKFVEDEHAGCPT